MPSLFHSLAIISFVIAINLSSHDAFRTSSSSNFRAKAPGVLRHVSSPNFESVKTMHSKFMETLDSRLYWGLNRTDTELCKSLDKEFAEVALPAFFSLAADPFASLVDAMYVGRLSAAEQAGMGIAISAQYSIAKLYNDPLIKTSTSLVAGKSDKELSASVSTAILTAIVIGVLQTALFLLFSDPILTIMGVPKVSLMRGPALGYLKYRAMGTPAATVLLVSIGIFRGRGDTKTPLACTALGNLINIVLDPIFIFGLNMGCAGAGAATAISQWCTIFPLLYLLNKSIPIELNGGSQFLKDAAVSYFNAGALIFLRTVSKIGAYSYTAAAAARLGPIPMAAYSLTFNLGFATSQLCEAVSIAAQALLARDFPFDSHKKITAARHVIKRALIYGLIVSGGLAMTTLWNQENILIKLSKTPEVRAAAAAIMPICLVTQVFKGLAYATGGVLLGGLDWFNSSFGMTLSSIVAVGILQFIPGTLWNIWVALAAFMATQVVVALARLVSGTGPWVGLELFGKQWAIKIDALNRKISRTPKLAL